MRHYRFFVRVATLVALLIYMRQANGAQPPTYTVIDLGVYVDNNNQVHSFFTVLNNLGQVAGVDALAQSPILWQNGTVTPLTGFSGVQSAVLAALNDNGQLAATVCCPIQPAVWQNGVLTLLPYANTGDFIAGATGINNSAQVAGNSGDGHSLGSYSAVVWTNNVPNVVDAGIPGHTNDAIAWGINNSGQVMVTDVSATYLWQTGTLTSLGYLPGAANTSGFAINNSGQIVGYLSNPGPPFFQHAFLWNGVLTDLGTLPGDTYSVAFGINDSGQVVGNSYGGSIEPFLYTDGTMYALGDLLTNSSGWGSIGYDGGTKHINNLGQILTTAKLNGVSHNVLLQPMVPGATPTGTNVSTQPTDAATGGSPVALTFTDVAQAGTTTLNESGTGAPPPAGLKLGNPPVYYNLSTTAVFSGPVSICINYSGVSFGNPSKLKLFHYENGVWVDITTSSDTTSSMICGTVTSFSPFAIFESAYNASVQQPIKSDGSSVFNAKKGVVPVKFTLMLSGAPTCQLPSAVISLTRTAGGTIGAVNETSFSIPSDSGSSFRIDSTNCQYIYNLGTGALGAGTYQVRITIDSLEVGSAQFGLQ